MHNLQPKTKTLLEDFLGTRGIAQYYWTSKFIIFALGKKYAQKTAGVVHAERTRARKKKGLKNHPY